MATHTLNINSLSFDLVQKGKKTLEVRVRKDGAENFAAGDVLLIRDRQTGEEIQKKITALNHYKSLPELLEHEDFRAAGAFETPEGFTDRMRSFQTEKEEEQYGLVAIHLG